jgi:hypothetical protein
MDFGASPMLPLLLLALRPALAYYVALDQASAPFLRTWDGRPVDWSVGPVAALVDTSLAVRVSSRGMHFYQHDVQPSAAGSACTRHASALCETEGGSLVFPETSAPRYAPGASRCGTDSVGRVVVANASIYDISMCDLVQGQLDVIYWRGQLFFDYNLYLPDWAYIITALSVLYLVVSLGQNIARVMGDDKAITNPLLTEVVALGQAVLIVSLHNPLRIFVAEHDRLMFGVVIGYLAIYLARHAFDLFMDKYVYTFNVITASLMLVTARLYCSFETPYSTIMMVLLMTRLAHKIHSQRKTPADKFTVAADSLLLALHYRYSFRHSFWDPQFAPLYAAPVSVACYVVGAITATQTGLIQ